MNESENKRISLQETLQPQSLNTEFVIERVESCR